jgi:hypothetical protein
VTHGCSNGVGLLLHQQPKMQTCHYMVLHNEVLNTNIFGAPP